MFIRDLRGVSGAEVIDGTRRAGVAYDDDTACRKYGTTCGPTDRNRIAVMSGYGGSKEAAARVPLFRAGRGSATAGSMV